MPSDNRSESELLSPVATVTCPNRQITHQTALCGRFGLTIRPGHRTLELWLIVG
jgi:hypothetical protein